MTCLHSQWHKRTGPCNTPRDLHQRRRTQTQNSHLFHRLDGRAAEAKRVARVATVGGSLVEALAVVAVVVATAVEVMAAEMAEMAREESRATAARKAVVERNLQVVQEVTAGRAVGRVGVAMEVGTMERADWVVEAMEVAATDLPAVVAAEGVEE